MVRKRHREESYALETPDTRLMASHYEEIIASLHAERYEYEMTLALYAQRKVDYDQWGNEVLALCNQVRSIHAKYKEQKRVNRSLRLQIADLE
jgi:hypothetical protein